MHIAPKNVDLKSISACFNFFITTSNGPFLLWFDLPFLSLSNPYNSVKMLVENCNGTRTLKLTVDIKLVHLYAVT